MMLLRGVNDRGGIIMTLIGLQGERAVDNYWDTMGNWRNKVKYVS